MAAKQRNSAFLAQQKRNKELVTQNNMLSDKIRGLRSNMRDLILSLVNQRNMTIDLLKENDIEIPEFLEKKGA